MNQETSKQKERWRWWLRLAIEVLIIIAVIVAIRAYTTRGTVTGPAPPFAATTLAGETVSLADLEGEPALVYFWASWCPICRAQQGSIAAISGDYRIITIAMQSGGPVEVQRYLNEHDWQVPVVVDEHGAFARAFGVRGVPASFVLDRKGIIRHVEVGYTTELGLRLRLWWAGR